MNLLLIVGFMFYILISLTQNLSKEVPRTETRLTDNRQSKDEADVYVTDTSVIIHAFAWYGAIGASYLIPWYAVTRCFSKVFNYVLGIRGGR